MTTADCLLALIASSNEALMRASKADEIVGDGGAQESSTVRLVTVTLADKGV